MKAGLFYDRAMEKLLFYTNKRVFHKQRAMKFLLTALFFISFSSCGGGGHFSRLLSQSGEAPLEESEAASLSVYFPQREEFKSIPELNKEEGKLPLSYMDKLVFLNPEDFLKNKEQLPKLEFLTEEELEENKKESQALVSSFCAPSLEKLKEEEEGLDYQISGSDPMSELEPSEEPPSRYSKQLIIGSKPAYINIINLIPKELLLQKSDQNIYCTFMLKLKSATYALLLQEINRGSQSSYQIFLTNPEKEFSRVESGDILNREDLKNIRFDIKMEEEAEKYHLECAGAPVLSVDRREEYPFKALFQNPAGDLKFNQAETCVFYASQKGNIKALSPRFQIDFSSWSAPEKEQLSLSEIEKFRFQKNRQENFVDILEIRDFDDITANKDYSHIDLVVDSKCFASKRSIEQVFTKKTRLPLRAETPIMAFFPEKIFFFLSKNKRDILFEREGIERKYSKELEKVKNSNVLHSLVYDLISPRDRSQAIKELSDEIYRNDLISEKVDDLSLADEGEILFNCVYTVTFEDKRKPATQKVFENQLYIIKLKDSRKNVSYKLGSNKDIKVIFNFSDFKRLMEKNWDLIDTDESNVKYRVYKDYALDLDKNSKSLGVFKPLSLEKNNFDKMSLKCYTEKIEGASLEDYFDFEENFKYIESSWSFDSDDVNEMIHLESILSDKVWRKKLDETKEDQRKDHLAVCRVFLYSNYGEGSFLKFFSPELNFIY